MVPRNSLEIVFFRNQDWHSDDLGSRNPVIQKQNSGNKCAITSIVERVSLTFQYLEKKKKENMED